MADERGVLRQISWRDLCPWLILFRTFRLAIRLPILFLATCGAILTPVGWNVAAKLFIGDELRLNDPAFVVAAERQGRWPTQSRIAAPGADFVRPPASVSDFAPLASSHLSTVFHSYVEPYSQLLSPGPSPAVKLAYWLFGAVWTLVVWAFCGGAITRIALVQLGREERVSLASAARFTLRRLRSHIIAPLFPLGGVAVVVVFSALLGFLMRANIGVLFGGVVWGLARIGGLVITVLLLGLLFGWPLMWGAISGEESGDEFEAFHRTYSYTYQRPLHYLFYAAVALGFGWLCFFLVDQFAAAVVTYSGWAVSWGTGWLRWSEVSNVAAGMPTDSTPLRWGGNLMDLWNSLVSCIVVGFRYSFFWCVAAAIYLLLRRDVDQTEFDELYVDDEPQRYGLPPLKPDAAGVPQLADPPPASAAAPATGNGDTSPPADATPN